MATTTTRGRPSINEMMSPRDKGARTASERGRRCRRRRQRRSIERRARTHRTTKIMGDDYISSRTLPPPPPKPQPPPPPPPPPPTRYKSRPCAGSSRTGGRGEDGSIDRRSSRSSVCRIPEGVVERATPATRRSHTLT